jgi:hypothetical protein
MTDVKSVVDRAMSYDMSDVMERYAEETRLPPEVLDEHEREIKRFLALSAAQPGKYGMRGPLDELWHTFIIFTSSYARFCESLGGGFIHHLPANPKERKRSKGGKKSSYVVFLEDYERAFREPPPAHVWPRPGGKVEDPSCDQCGIWCSETCAAIQIEPQEQQRF